MTMNHLNDDVAEMLRHDISGNLFNNFRRVARNAILDGIYPDADLDVWLGVGTISEDDWHQQVWYDVQETLVYPLKDLRKSND